VKIKKYFKTKQLIGLYILIIGLCIIVRITLPEVKVIYILLAFLIIISIHLIIKSLSSRKKRMIVPGITLLFLSIFILIYLLFLNNFVTMNHLWPIIGIFPAISLIIYYIISEIKSPATVIPGIYIGILSIVLFLITMNIIQLKFINFLIMLIAGMLIIIGLYLIFYKKNNNNQLDQNITKKIL
jgi:hypothetical protein